MLTDLCDLLSSKMQNMSNRKKAAIFIGTIHIQTNPVFSLMHTMAENIPYTDFALTAMDFLKNNDKILKNETTFISITEKGWLKLSIFEVLNYNHNLRRL